MAESSSEEDRRPTELRADDAILEVKLYVLALINKLAHDATNDDALSSEVFRHLAAAMGELEAAALFYQKQSGDD